MTWSLSAHHVVSNCRIGDSEAPSYRWSLPFFRFSSLYRPVSPVANWQPHSVRPEWSPYPDQVTAYRFLSQNCDDFNIACLAASRESYKLRFHESRSRDHASAITHGCIAVLSVISRPVFLSVKKTDRKKYRIKCHRTCTKVDRKDE